MIIEVLKGKKQNRVPIWIMRQAGRYLPEYRELSLKSGGFLSMVYNPELAAEVTLQPIRRFDFDAAIIFSDILTVPAALGCQVEFGGGTGPLVTGEIKKVDADEFTSRLRPVYEAISLVRKNLNDSKTLIGFAGSAWTIVCYLIEQNLQSRAFSKIKRAVYLERAKIIELIDIVADYTIIHLVNQIKAGAEVVQLFDSWASVVAASNFSDLVIEPTKKIVSAVKKQFPHIPVIGFPKQCGTLIKDYIAGSMIDAVGIDYSYSTNWIKDNIEIPFQGNLDPLMLAYDLPRTLLATRDILKQFQNMPFIFNLGHGIIPETPLENVRALIDEVRGFKSNL